MSIRTTVTLGDDVLGRVKHECQVRGESFQDTLNDLLRFALPNLERTPARRTLRIKASYGLHTGSQRGILSDLSDALIA